VTEFASAPTTAPTTVPATTATAPLNLQHYWWPLATVAEVAAGKPLARTLHQLPLVVFCTSPPGAATLEVAVLPDRCPHRHAPLSQGKIKAGTIECPYHGWRFNAEGCCCRVPGLSDRGKGEHPLLSPIASCIAHGLVWACLIPHENTPPPVGPATVNAAIDYFWLEDTVQCTLVQGAENLLDGFHTHFVHAGWIRRDAQRQTVQATVHRLPDGIEARYHNEGLQSGIISSLLEGDRQSSAGRFRLPGLAEIEYQGRRGLNLLVTAWLIPAEQGTLKLYARVATRKGWLPAAIKAFFLRRLFAVILRQDKQILETTAAHIAKLQCYGPQPAMLDSPLDLLGPSIRRLLAGESLGDEVERTQSCAL
jgi:phenylpropionate dioxygenase-like ring-hydroxylating dioxygenase large terminal subunit